MILHEVIASWTPPPAATSHLHARIRRRRRQRTATVAMVAAAGIAAAAALTPHQSAAYVAPPPPAPSATFDLVEWLAGATAYDPDSPHHALARCDGQPPAATTIGIDPLVVGRGSYDVGLHLPPCELTTAPSAIIDAQIRIYAEAEFRGGVGLEVTMRNLTDTTIVARYGSSIVTLVTPPGPPELGRHSSSITGFGGTMGAWGTAWDGPTVANRFYSSPGSARAYDWAAGVGLVVRHDFPLSGTAPSVQRASSLDTITIGAGEQARLVLFVGYEAGVTSWERVVLTNYDPFDWVTFLTENLADVRALYQLDLLIPGATQGWPLTVIDVDVPITLDVAPPGA